MLLENEFVRLGGVFVLSFIISFVSIPSIVNVAHLKQLFDEPGTRKLHSRSVPTLGGLAIFAGLLISVNLFKSDSIFPELQYVVASSVVIFFLGIKDDILVTAPLTKLGGQLFASFILIIAGDIRITSLHGFYGITDIPYWASIGLSLFVYIVIINGYNLIDGIDGLCSGLGVVASVAFGVWFSQVGQVMLAILAFSLSGALLAFMWFNLFGKKNKLFLGDTGALLVGHVVAVLAFQFNEVNIHLPESLSVHAAPGVAFGILIVPLFDILRVMFIRLVMNRSPFRPDKNHLHHSLLDIGLSHKQATLTLVLVNVVFVAFVFLVNDYCEILRLVLLILLLSMVLSFIPSIIHDRQRIRKMANTDAGQVIKNRVTL